MNGRSTVLGIQPNRGPNALPSPDGSSPAKELTIGSYGCVVTFFARLASTISGLKITPEIINQYCIDNNLFDVDMSDDYKDQTLLSVENGCKAINGLLEKNNIKNIKIEVAEIFAITDDKSLIDKLNMYDADKMNYYMFGIRIDDKHTVNLNKSFENSKPYTIRFNHYDIKETSKSTYSSINYGNLTYLYTFKIIFKNPEES
mgnify:FL=1